MAPHLGPARPPRRTSRRFQYVPVAVKVDLVLVGRRAEAVKVDSYGRRRWAVENLVVLQNAMTRLPETGVAPRMENTSFQDTRSA